MRLLCVPIAVAVVLALFLLYVFFSMSKESFVGATCDNSVIINRLEDAKQKLLRYKTECDECDPEGPQHPKCTTANLREIKQAIRKINVVLGKDKKDGLDDWDDI